MLMLGIELYRVLTSYKAKLERAQCKGRMQQYGNSCRSRHTNTKEATSITSKTKKESTESYM